MAFPSRPPAGQQYAVAMRRALDLADIARRDGDVPVGALVLDPGGAVVGEGWNVRERDGDPLGHAEVVALREASARHTPGEGWRLVGHTLVVTLEPCPMCAGALMLARVERVVFGAWDDKLGSCGSVWDLVRDRRANHRVEVLGGILEEECAGVLRDFFRSGPLPGASAAD